MDVEETAVASSPAQFRSLIAGELDVVLTSPDNVIAYRYSPTNPLGETIDARIISAIDRGLGLALYGRPGGTTPTGVDAPTSKIHAPIFGVDVPTSGFAFVLYALAESLGLNRDAYQLTPLGSTPKRLQALLAGECDATMLNAGNELRAELAGCRPLARVRDVCHPYLGTVLAVVGSAHLAPAMRLAEALRTTAATICTSGRQSGRQSDQQWDDVILAEASDALQLPLEQARRYVQRLRDPDEGLVVDGRVDPASLRTIVDLRRRYLPCIVDGVDLLADALNPDSGLLVR